MEQKKLHVLVITTWYPNGVDQLIGVYHKLFCSALAKSGAVKVNMLYIDRQGFRELPRYPMMQKQYVDDCDGYKTYCRRMLDVSKLGFDRQMRAYVKRVIALYRQYEAINGKPDVLHAQVAVPAGYAACVLGEEIGVPVILTEHATYFERFFTGREAKYCDYVMQHAAKITCVGDFMRETFAKHGRADAEVLPNIVDCAAYAGAHHKAADGKLHIISVCALRIVKRIDDVVRALKLLKDENRLPDFVYTVVGDGFEGEIFKAAVQETHMEDCVRFVGQKETAEIAALFSESDMLVMASDIETFGIPAIEALAAGVPVVCTRCKGPEDFLTLECAEFCALHDVEDLARAIERMYKRLPEIDEGLLRTTAAQFDGAAVANLAISYYNEILK